MRIISSLIRFLAYVLSVLLRILIANAINTDMLDNGDAGSAARADDTAADLSSDELGRSYDCCRQLCQQAGPRAALHGYVLL